MYFEFRDDLNLVFAVLTEADSNIFQDLDMTTEGGYYAAAKRVRAFLQTKRPFKCTHVKISEYEDGANELVFIWSSNQDFADDKAKWYELEIAEMYALSTYRTWQHTLCVRL